MQSSVPGFQAQREMKILVAARSFGGETGVKTDTSHRKRSANLAACLHSMGAFLCHEMHKSLKIAPMSLTCQRPAADLV